MIAALLMITGVVVVNTAGTDATRTIGGVLLAVGLTRTVAEISPAAQAAGGA